MFLFYLPYSSGSTLKRKKIASLGANSFHLGLTHTGRVFFPWKIIGSDKSELPLIEWLKNYEGVTIYLKVSKKLIQLQYLHHLMFMHRRIVILCVSDT